MTDNGIHVIESPEYDEDVNHLMLDPRILDMADELRAGGTGLVERFLLDPGAVGRACDEARSRGAEFKFIGSPHRALVALLTKEKT
jgi:hypothetical protein